MILIPLWLRLTAGAAMASGLVFGGYKIGAWREAAAGADAAKTAAANLATCNASLATQRETDLTGANHALADQLHETSELATKDAARLADLATKMQRDALAFGADTRALYAIEVGGCNLTPDFVRLLIYAADQANGADRNGGADKTPAHKADVGNGGSAAVPDAAGRSRSAVSKGTGADLGSPVH